MRIKADFPDYRKQLGDAAEAVATFPKYAADATLSFSREAFRRQGWIDDRLERWAPRKNNRDKRAILVGKGSGALRRGLSVRHDADGWTISSDRKYAKIHNEGGTISVTVTKKMRKFFWAMHYKARTNKDKAFWRGMALTRKTVLKVNMPKRQFMGHSKLLERRLVFHMQRALGEALKG